MTNAPRISTPIRSASTRGTKATRPAKSNARPSVSYWLELANGGARRLTIPGDWRITFGFFVPDRGKSGDHFVAGQRSRLEHAFRAYEGQKLRLCYTDVVSFYDDAVKTDDYDLIDRAARELTKNGKRSKDEAAVMLGEAINKLGGPDT